MVMTPDCDLEQDFEARQVEDAPESRLIPRVLLCEVQEAAELKKSSGLNSRLWRQVRQNQHERYQFVRSVAAFEDAASEGLPELALDFKRVLAVPTDELYVQIHNGIVRRRTVMVDRYLFHFVQRFYSFQGRIGVPIPHDQL